MPMPQHIVDQVARHVALIRHFNEDSTRGRAGGQARPSVEPRPGTRPTTLSN